MTLWKISTSSFNSLQGNNQFWAPLWPQTDQIKAKEKLKLENLALRVNIRTFYFWYWFDCVHNLHIKELPFSFDFLLVLIKKCCFCQSDVANYDWPSLQRERGEEGIIEKPLWIRRRTSIWRRGEQKEKIKWYGIGKDSRRLEDVIYRCTL